MTTPAAQRRMFAVDGLFCGGCARGLENRVRAIEGVTDAAVHFVTASMLVTWSPSTCDVERIRAGVRNAGYLLHDRSDMICAVQRFDSEVRSLALRLTVAVAFGMWSMAAALVVYATPEMDQRSAWWVAMASGVLSLPVLTYSASDIVRMAVRSVRLRTPGLDLMVVIGAAGASILSAWKLAEGGHAVYFDTATMLVTFLLLGRIVETRSRRSALRSLVAMADAAPETALPAAGGTAVRAIDVAVGDDVHVEAGGVATVDGVVVEGKSLIDRSLLTGETAPVAVNPGSIVSAGSVNLLSRITLRVARQYGDRDIDRMGGRIAVELAARGEPTRTVDQLASALTIVLPLIAIVALIVLLLLGTEPEAAAARALSVLLVACPCALAIAAPLAIVRAVAAGGEIGVRIADGGVIDALGRVRTVIFDKTGTLTLGELAIVAVVPSAGWNADELMALAASAEAGIDHPIARAILAASRPPTGAVGIRNPRSALSCDPECGQVSVQSAIGHDGDSRTWLEVRMAGALVGNIALADQIAPEARATVEALVRRGIAVHLATGDAGGPALAVAAQVGIPTSRVAAGCTPAGKVDYLKTCQRPVLFVGDGINDAPALVAADCSISVARAHSAAVATASIAIVDGGLGAVPQALGLGRRTRAVIAQNMAFALTYNAVAIPLAVAGAVTPLIAAATMVASSVMVTLNAMRAGPKISSAQSS